MKAAALIYAKYGINNIDEAISKAGLDDEFIKLTD